MVPRRLGAERPPARSVLSAPRGVMRAVPRLLAALLVLCAAPALGGAVAGAREVQAPSPEIEVLDAGAAPREALRLAPSPGASEQVAMTLHLGIELSGESDRTIKTPPLRATIAAALQDVTPNGDLHATFSYPAFEVLKGDGASARQRRETERALSGLSGLSGELTLTPRGALVDSKLDIPPDLDPSLTALLDQLRDQFRDLTVPLPEPEIGVGARWRATTQLTINDIQTRQVFEYRLKKRTDSTLELDVRGTQTAKPQTVDSPGGVKLRVKSYKTTIRGATTMDLTHLLPVTSRIRASADQTFDVRARGESGEVRQQLDLRVEVKPA
jgi:Family of unknown function (DUF6263)